MFLNFTYLNKIGTKSRYYKQISNLKSLLGKEIAKSKWRNYFCKFAKMKGTISTKKIDSLPIVLSF